MLLTPNEIGMPEQFTAWRTGQDEAIDRVIDAFGERRFVVMCAPVGSGKTATYVGVALLMGWRVLCITSDKGLQDQLMRDFAGIGMVDIRGRANYHCTMGASLTCEDGAHMRCSDSRTEACPYRAAYNAALKAQLVTTNYTYKMLMYLYSEGLGKFDLVVLDEAHDADQEVCGVMGQTFTASRQIHLGIAAGVQWRNPSWTRISTERGGIGRAPYRGQASGTLESVERGG
jgi:Rad3-related DNA helicase